MIAACDYAQVYHELANAFRYRYRDREVGDIRMVGLLFAPPEARLARDEIVLGLDYFHHRSGNNIDFFCAGHRRYGYARQPEPHHAIRTAPEKLRRGLAGWPRASAGLVGHWPSWQAVPAVGRNLDQPAHRMYAHEDAAGIGRRDLSLALETLLEFGLNKKLAGCRLNGDSESERGDSLWS